MIDAWFYSPDGKSRLGPVSFARLQQLAATGRLRPTDYVHRAGMPRWVQAGSVPELFPLADVLPAGEAVLDAVPAMDGGPGAAAGRPSGRPVPLLPLSVRSALKLLGNTAGVVGFLLFLAGTTRLIVFLASAHRQDLTLLGAMTCFEQRLRWAPQFLPEGKLELTPWDLEAQGRDADKLRQLFPDEAERRAVLDWGTELVASWRGPYVQHAAEVESNPLSPDRDLLPGLRKVCEVPVDERLAGQAAWRRLTCAPGTSEADLGHLKEVVAKGLPDAQERAALLAWAGRRRTQKHVEVASFYRDVPAYWLAPIPPDTEWFRYWILYEDWAATDEVFAARKADLLATFGGERKFGRDTWHTLLAWGGDLAQQRRQRAEEELPPEGERAAVLAVTDHLAGLEDEPFTRTRAFLDGHLDLADVRAGSKQAWVGNFLFELVQYLSPSDDYTKLSMGRGWTRDRTYPAAPGQESLSNADLEDGWYFWGMWYLIWTVFLGGAGWLIYRGMRLLTIGLPGRLLGLSNNPHFQAFRAALEHPRWLVTTVAVLIALTCLASVLSLDSFFILYFPSYGPIVFSTVWSVLLGGVLVEGIANLITLGLIRLGRDPEKTWLGGVLALAVTVPLLWFFDNSWYAILCSLAIGLAPGLLCKLLEQSKSAPQFLGKYTLRALYQSHPVGVLVAGSGVVLFGCLFACCGGVLARLPLMAAGDGSPARQAAPSRAAHVLTAPQLAAEYQEDPGAQEQKYKGKWLQLSGNARAGGRHPGTHYCVPLDTEMDGAVVFCLFDGVQARYAARQHDRAITVVGKYAGGGRDEGLTVLRLRECVVVEQGK